MDDPPELAWRISTAEERFRQRQRRWRVLLAAAAAFFVVAFTFTESARWFGMAGTVLLAGVVWSWQRSRERQDLTAGEPNIGLNAAGFRWRKTAGDWQCLPREAIVGYRIQPLLKAGDEPCLVFLLNDCFESQSISRGSLDSWETVRGWLTEHWSLEEIPSPAASEIVVDSVRWEGVYEYDLSPRELHWHADRANLTALAGFLRRAADEIPQPPVGAKPKWLEVVGSEEGEEFLMGVDRDPWIDGGSLAGPPVWLRQIATEVDGKLAAGETNFTMEVKTFSRPWTLGFHVE